MDIYKEVTDRIISQLDQGIIPWHKPRIASSNAQSISHVRIVFVNERGNPITLTFRTVLGIKIHII